MLKRYLIAAGLALATLSAAPLSAQELQESAFWQSEVDTGNLPPVAERMPSAPLLVDLVAGTEGQ